VGLFAKRDSGRKRTRRFDLEAAAKGSGPRGIATVFRSDRLLDVLIAFFCYLVEVALFVGGIVRLDDAARLGVALVVAGVNVVVGMYLSFHHKDILRDRRSFVLFQAVGLAALALAKLFLVFAWPELLFPLGVFAITLSVAYGPRLAVFWAVTMAGMVGLMRGLELHDLRDKAGNLISPELVPDFGLALTLAGGALTAVLSLEKVTRRSKVIQAGFFAGLAFAIMTAAARWLLPVPDALRAQNLRELGVFCAFGFLNGLFTGYFMVEFGLRFVERAFDVVTDLRLQELTDLNQPILKKFAIEAPGTFHHSQMVGTLAEAAAEAIGANPLLCRVGAHFHDIGKMAKPDYFIENAGQNGTRHVGLTPTMSTLIIVSHVKDGVEMAEELGLPERVIDCIPEHHGTIAVEYFYHEAVKQQHELGGPEVSKDDFRYPGPKPQSKETAILMIADSVEAISRMLAEPNAVRIEQMVHDVVMRRLTEGQLDECGITLRELKEVERAMCRVLLGIHHARIRYPKELAGERPDRTPPGGRERDDTTSRMRVAAALADGPGTPSAAVGGGVPGADDAPAQPEPAVARKV
jgi:putative nucleotidyltransferase with HDIG domain